MSERSLGEMGVGLGDGAGAFSPPFRITVGIRRPRHMVVADMNRDSKADVAVVPDTSSALNPAGVSVVLNTNCQPRHLVNNKEITADCASASVPFPAQPEIRIEDDGGNIVQCDMDSIAASILPGTGTGGAMLGGTGTQPPASGVAIYTDLSVDLAGRGYQFEFMHPAARRALSRTFSQSISINITGPNPVCASVPVIYDAEPGFDMYNWTLDAAPISMGPNADATGLLVPGMRTLAVTGQQDSCNAGDSEVLDVIADLSSVTTSPGGPHVVCPSCTGPR